MKKKFQDFLIKEQQSLSHHREYIRPYSPQIYIRTPSYKKLIEINQLWHNEIAKIKEEYKQKIRDLKKKYNEIRGQINPDIEETEKIIKKILLGKIIHMNISPEGGPVIKRVIDVKCFPVLTKKTKNLKTIIMELKFKDGSSKEFNYKYCGFSILNDLLNHLDKNKGKEIIFVGALISDLKEFKNYSEYIRRFYAPNVPLPMQRQREFQTKLEKIEIISTRIGDFIALNGTYVYDLYQPYKFINVKITERDPYGEEDWEDDGDDSYQKYINKMSHQYDYDYGPSDEVEDELDDWF